MQEDYNEQQQIANDIRAEASNLLEEIRILTKKNEELTSVDQSRIQTIKRLEAEIQQLKSSQSTASSINNLNEHKRPAGKSTFRDNVNIDFGIDDIVDAGIIQMTNIKSYQKAINDLMIASK